jgi:hypothetical protein
VRWRWRARRRRPLLGWAGCYSGPGRLAWVRAEAEGPRFAAVVVALEIDVVAEEVRNLLPDGVEMAGPTPIGKDEVGLLRSAEQLRTVTGVPAAGDEARLGVRVALVREANTAAGPDRRRSQAEMLATSDELTRLMLLEASGEQAPVMLCGLPVYLTSGPKTKHSNSGEAKTRPSRKAR